MAFQVSGERERETEGEGEGRQRQRQRQRHDVCARGTHVAGRAQDYKEGKAANKAALQKELGLDEDPGRRLSLSLSFSSSIALHTSIDT